MPLNTLSCDIRFYQKLEYIKEISMHFPKEQVFLYKVNDSTLNRISSTNRL